MRRCKYDGAALRAIRAEKGVGRSAAPPAGPYMVPPPLQYLAAVTEHGSQRKAAAALGISLGKLQRELKKAV